MTFGELEQLERELEREDAVVKRAAEALEHALRLRSQIMERFGERLRLKDRHLTPIVFILARWSRWKSFNLPAAGVGPFTSTDDANAWAEWFNKQQNHDPDELHAAEWYQLVSPGSRLVVENNRGNYSHAWRKTKLVIYECPCGEQESRKPADGAPRPGGCSGLHNRKTDKFEPIAQSPPSEVRE